MSPQSELKPKGYYEPNYARDYLAYYQECPCCGLQIGIIKN